MADGALVTVKDKVDAFYKKAIALGATCEGPPARASDNFYAAYFRDLEQQAQFFHMG